MRKISLSFLLKNERNRSRSVSIVKFDENRSILHAGATYAINFNPLSLGLPLTRPFIVSAGEWKAQVALELSIKLFFHSFTARLHFLMLLGVFFHKFSAAWNACKINKLTKWFYSWVYSGFKSVISSQAC